MEAQAVFQEDGRIYVVCPYCYTIHQHGDGGFTDVSGNIRMAHCSNGEYKIKGMFDFRIAHMMMTRREVDIRRKKEARMAAKQNAAKQNNGVAEVSRGGDATASA